MNGTPNVLETLTVAGNKYEIVAFEHPELNTKYTLFGPDGEKVFSGIEPFTVGLAREIIHHLKQEFNHGVACGKQLKSTEIRRALGITDNGEGDNS